MPSPFPGMDPYLETPDVWRDFHHRYIPVLSASLMRNLPAKYIVKVEETVYIRELSAQERRLVGRPDAAVVSLAADRQPAPAAAVAERAPVTAELIPAVDIERVPYLEVLDRQSRTVVTAIKLLSPSNKSNPDDRTAYIAKRQQFRAGSAHFVEIDLLRGGPRMPLIGLPTCDYYALISRAEDRPRVGVWPVMLRDRLPTISIPLAHGDPDIALDLQGALDQVYDDAGYARYVYDGRLDPPLNAEDQSWAAAIVGNARPG
jgi:hypothetical protein